MSFVNRQLYKQKPSAWGPASSVQASIFKNAEKVGIDPTSCDFVFRDSNALANYNNLQRYTNTYYSPDVQTDSLKTSASNQRISTGIQRDIKFLFFKFLVHEYQIESTNQSYYFIKDVSVSSGIALGSVTTYLTSETITILNSSNTSKRTGINSPLEIGVHTLSINWIGDRYEIMLDGVAQNTIVASGGHTPLLTNVSIDVGGRPSLGTPHIAPSSLIVSSQYVNNACYFHDNPYFLLHRVPTVFYSVPGGGIIIKNITDSCLGTDSIAQISNFFSVSDAGTGADGFAGLTAGLSVVDAGSGVDTVKPIASLTVQDTGSAIDLIQQVSAACSVADTGTGTDSIGQLLASLVVSDAGAGADVITVLKELLKTVTDSGTGTDSISRILASLSVADTGSSTDTISQILAGVSVSDTGTGVDFIALLKDILKTISDTGSGSDSVSIQPVSVSVQDAGTALDIIGHIAVALSVSDAGTIAEIISTIKTKMVTVTDTGTGSDSAPTISVSLTVSDTAAALDLVGQVINALTVSDTGTGLESITKTDFNILPSGKVTVTFTIKTPGASLAMRTPKANFNIE